MSYENLKPTDYGPEKAACDRLLHVIEYSSKWPRAYSPDGRYEYYGRLNQKGSNRHSEPRMLLMTALGRDNISSAEDRRHASWSVLCVDNQADTSEQLPVTELFVARNETMHSVHTSLPADRDDWKGETWKDQREIVEMQVGFQITTPSAEDYELLTAAIEAFETTAIQTRLERQRYLHDDS